MKSRDLLAVDPGIRGCGVALFSDGRLLAADYVKNPDRRPGEADSMTRVCMVATVIGWANVHGVHAWAFAGELMQVYGNSDSGKNPNDLIQLAAIIGGLESAGTTSTTYLPRTWKGNVPKPRSKLDPYIIETRVRECLEPAELAALPLHTGPMWDAIDAAGIGLFHLGRLFKRRVIAR